jgi:hypothetical protein
MRMNMFLPTLLLAAAPLAAQAALAPASQSFKLKVTTSFEAPFTDCWTFSSNGRFIHSPSLRNFPYQLTNLNTNANNWQAIWVGRVSIAFSGAVSGTSITGNAVDAQVRTYSITGSKVSGCGAPAPQQGGWHGV